VAASGGQLVLTAHPHRCLLLYPATAWEPIRDKVLAASSLHQQAAAIKRLLVGNAREEAMDSAGRLLVAPELRQFAQLDKLVWLVGQGTHFEIWSDAGWQQQQDAIFAMGDQALPPPGLDGASARRSTGRSAGSGRRDATYVAAATASRRLP
jgi:MraZ protein